MRYCRRCKTAQDDGEFYRSQPNRCRTCNKHEHRIWVENNRERNREISRLSARRHRKEKRKKSKEYYRLHREEMIAAEKERYKKQKINRLAKAKELYVKRREAAYIQYGNKCKCCGESQRMFLQFDHINNDGYAHRKKVSPGQPFFKWLIKNKFPNSIQLLCANCNHGKRLNHGICPHIMLACHGIEILET